MSRLERKKPEANLKKYYTILLQTGLIIALVVFIVAVKVDLRSLEPEAFEIEEQDIIEMEEIPMTEQMETPPPPPKPPIPQEVPNDEVIDETDININAELSLDGPLEPPPPPSNEEEEPEENFFEIVEHMPELVGGQQALQGSIEYPERAIRAGIEGRVFVQFIVNTDGNVENPQILRGIGGGCDEEAIRAIREAEFIPGRQRGRPVRVRMSLPVIFQLQE